MILFAYSHDFTSFLAGTDKVALFVSTDSKAVTSATGST